MSKTEEGFLEVISIKHGLNNSYPYKEGSVANRCRGITLFAIYLCWSLDEQNMYVATQVLLWQWFQ